MASLATDEANSEQQQQQQQQQQEEGGDKAPADNASSSSPAGDSWLDLIAFEAGKIEKTEAGEISLEGFISAFHHRFITVYDVLFGGMMGNQLKSDLEGNFDNLVARKSAETPGIEGTIKSEMESKGAKACKKDSKGPVMALLWSKRAMDFIVTFVELLIENKMTPSECSSKIYQEKLKPYHGWFTSKIVGTAMGMCPTREDIMKKFTFTSEDEMTAAMGRFVKVMRPLIDQIHAALEAAGANFPDKV